MLKNRIKKIDELISIRNNLFENLGEIINFKKILASSRNDLVNRITTTNVLENELNNARRHYDDLDREKITKIRMQK